MIKRAVTLISAWTLLLGLCTSCQNTTEQIDNAEQLSWKEQYDLGLRYLSEGNYDEAIIAFTVAIEIDPKRALAYVGRGDAYILSGETEENLTAAQMDYEQAINLDETFAEAYLGLADVYIRRGDYDKALEVLWQGLDKTGSNQDIVEKIAEIESGMITDSANRIRRMSTFDMDGAMIEYTEFDYDELGRQCSWRNYNKGESGDFVMDSSCEVTFNAQNQPALNQFYDADGNKTEYDTFVYNNDGQTTEQYRFETDGTEIVHFFFRYDDQGRQTQYEGYYPDGTMYNYWVSEYDEMGNFVQEICYDPETNEPIHYSISD